MKKHLSNSPRTWIEINKKALENNITVISEYIEKKQHFGAVIKSNAYGHGLKLIGRLLDKNPKISWLFTAGLEEAINLRKNRIQKPILVMSYIDADPILALKYNIHLTISHTSQIKNLSLIAKNCNKKIKIHLKIDTGLSRLGILADNAKETINDLLKNKSLEFSGIFTHLADNKNELQDYNKKQLLLFEKIVNYIPKPQLKNMMIHAQASASLYTGTHKFFFNMIRIGSALYGVYKSPLQEQTFTQNNKKLLPVLSWKTKIIEIKTIAPQTPVSYGCTYITKKQTTIAIAPIGHFDGYPTALANKNFVYIHNIPAPVIGAITMNMIVIDITHIKTAKINSEITLIGNSKEISAAKLATVANRITIELLTGINPNIKRITI